MINILVFGFGGIGSRHVQSLLNLKNIKIYVVEKSLENFKTNLNNLRLNNVQIAKLHHYESIKKISTTTFDIVIHATNADVRLSTIKELIFHLKFQHIIIEKICFQNEEQFSEASNLFKLNNIKTYVHLPMRYYSSTKFLLELPFDTKEISNVVIQGSNLGILCNSIHYLDFLSFIGFAQISNSEITDFVKTEAKLVESKRGGNYYEAEGKVRINFKNFYLEFIDLPDKGFKIDLSRSISISNDGIFQNGNILYPEFRKFTSELTETIVQNIIHGMSKLPSLDETFIYHKMIFNLYRTISSQNPQNIPVT
jgi:siroheme synthase (precorrin-2 oxidase/ferrochelatase)